MAVFWQHVGDQNSRRDLPRTIGTPSSGLREFSLTEIESGIDVECGERADLARRLARIGNGAFQIWGFPSGAEEVLRKMETGDYLLLLDSNADWGSFRYFGRVFLRLPGKQWKLSERLWGEGRYPIVTFVRGQLVNYPWPNSLMTFNMVRA
jgi:hypothetical protein